MKNFFKSFALVPRGLRYKLILIFCLMSIIPILALLYIISAYVFAITANLGNLLLTIGLSLVIAFLGFILAGSIIDPIIKMSKSARDMIEGGIVSELTIRSEDEIGDLGASLNLLTGRLNKNMSELKSYESRIREINMEINKKVLALSTLFQVGNVMSSAADLNVILQFIVEKAYELITSEKVFLMLVEPRTNELVAKAVHNIKTEDISGMRVKVGDGFLGQAVKENKTFIADESHKAHGLSKNYLMKNEFKNIMVAPILMRLRPVGLIACTNSFDAFSYKEEDIELLNIFSKQASIAVENDILLKKTEQLAIKDELTGLYNTSYLRTRLEEEIQRAIVYQRPCSFILIEIDDFKNYHEKNGTIAVEAVIRKIAKMLEEKVEQVDRVARFEDEEFAVICPEKNKMEALNIAENIRKEVENFNFPHAETQPGKKITVSAGVSANPIDGITSDELIAKARLVLEQIKKEGKNKAGV